MADKFLRCEVVGSIENSITVKPYVDGAGIITVYQQDNILFDPETLRAEGAKGEWIVHLYKVGVSRYECDACHARCDIIYPYCPYCGEKKEGERDATD